ncbi:MAG: hypothetical protein ACR2NP_08875 [Pirellulaceae bacterium]
MTTHSSFLNGERIYGNGDAKQGMEFPDGVEPPASPDIHDDHTSLQREVAGNAIIQRALQKLLRAWQFSIDCDRSKWDFAVELADLDALDISHDELRWLIGKNLVEHAQEIEAVQGIGRSFESPGGYTFSGKSCFVITSTGRELLDHTDPLPCGEPVVVASAIASVINPVWDDQRHELRVGQVLVKRFKWRASNQEAILSAFEEDGWPARIDDPLPPVPDTDPKRRLSDTIKCLNRKQQNSLVRFSGDGTGEGVLWDLVSCDQPSTEH